jgi:CRISPR-associated protein (TIGR03986 family)
MGRGYGYDYAQPRRRTGGGWGGQRRAPTRPLPDKARAPYNFVPLAKDVVFPDWADKVTQDIPFREGMSGELDVEIRAETPLFVRGGDGQRFFRLPDGTLAIPGSSLRGMLRNVVEIATFSKMSRVNNHRYGVRDLHNREVYGRYMAAIVNRKPTPLVCAGWLRVREGDQYEDGEPKWEIIPCNFAKIEYGLLKRLAAQRRVKGFDPGRKQSAPSKYRRWGDKSLEFTLHVRERPRNVAGVRLRGKYGEVVEAGGVRVSGTLVFTGQPSEYNPEKLRRKRRGAGNPKHHDFFFYGTDGGPIEVPQEKRRDFSFLHSSGGEQHRLDSDPNEEWKYMLQSRLRQKKPVPVFYLLDERGELRAFGLAMMFRLAYRKSTREAVLRVQKHAQSLRPDMAELLFGRVTRDDDGGRTLALRGRVSTETARAAGPVQELGPVSGVLGAPKASYYPNYLIQGDAPGREPPRMQNGKPRYTTYQDDNARARGWKRYPQRTDVAALPEAPSQRVKTTFRPIAAGAVFRTKIHFHNLLPQELGALVWALDFGGRPECRHGLGMAKAFGYGGVTLRVVGGAIVPNDPLRPRTELEDALGQAREAFIGYMEKALQGRWAVSPQIHQLVTMAMPVNDPDLRHMLISHPQYRNEFAGVKQAGKALPLRNRPLSYAEWRKQCSSPRSTPIAVAAPATPSPQPQAESTGDEELDALIRELRQAQRTGDHLRIIRDRWMGADDGRRELYRKAARAVIGSANKKWRKKNRDIWDWMKGA